MPPPARLRRPAYRRGALLGAFSFSNLRPSPEALSVNFKYLPGSSIDLSLGQHCAATGFGKW